jgi:hypothetical protein
VASMRISARGVKLPCLFLGAMSLIDPVRKYSGTPIGEAHWKALAPSDLFAGLPRVTAFQGSAGLFAGAVHIESF